MLYNLAYLAALLACSPYLAWRSWRTGRYRRGWGAKLWGHVPVTPEGDGPVVWLHAVSVGEVNLLATILEPLERAGRRCVISATTDTGYALAVEKYGPRTVFYCPLDLTWAVRRAVRRVRPEMLVLAELELWPNLIRLAGAGGARVAVFNGRLSARSAAGYGRIRWLIRRWLSRIDLLLVQSERYAERFRELGAPAERVRVTGSLKFDGAQADRNNAATAALSRLAGLRDDDIVLLAGSTQAGEEQMALEAFQTLAPQHPRLRLIITPRHPERFDEVARLIERAGVRSARRSALPAESGAAAPWDVLLIDRVGELGAWWGTAQIAYVGGSMGRRGGQNMIEPAGYGCAVCFGPRTENFRDVVQLLLAAEAATVVADPGEFTRFVVQCLENPAEAARQGARARELVLAQQGAAERTVALLTELPPAASRRSRAA